MTRNFAYRVGTHAEFKTAMLDAISRSLSPALEGLRTRQDEDFSIALCDAIAVLADNLSFYQERLAAESYLNTAIDLRSVRELAALIGYRPAPGIAASTWVAFTIEEPPDAADRSHELTIPARTRVQSVPASSEERPQVFETDAAIDARPKWNALQPRLTMPYLPEPPSTDLYLKGATVNIRPGDMLLLVDNNPKHGHGSLPWRARVIKTVDPQPALDSTHITWIEPLGPGTPKRPHAFVFRERAAIFGHNAPDWSGQPDTYKASYFGFEVPDQLTLADRVEWPHFDIYAPDTKRQKNTYGRFVDPTAEDVADAMEEAIREALEAQSKAVAAAVMQANSNVGQQLQKTLTEFAGSITELAKAGMVIPEMVQKLWNDVLSGVFQAIKGFGDVVGGLGGTIGDITDAIKNIKL